MGVRIISRALLGAGFAILPVGSAAWGQAVDVQVPDIPQQDYNCDFSGFSNPTNVGTDCIVDGTRTVTFTGQSRAPRSATTDLVTNTYDVTFAGNLQVDGVPVVTAVPFQFPFGGGLEDADVYFDTTSQTVNVNASYTAVAAQLVGNGAPTPPPPADPVFFQATDITTEVNTIDVHADGNISTTSGGDYDYTLNSIDPAAVTNDTVALTGTFSGTSGTGAIQFGRLSGSAQVLSGPIITPYPDYTGAVNTGLLSTYQLDYNVTAQVTTNLDADGLTTPQVTVTEGIEMNGSRITNLGDGVAPGDAVNRGQLDAEATARQTADVQLAGALETEATTRAQVDFQLSQRLAIQEAAMGQYTTDLASESAARLAADNALSARIDAVGSRLDTIDARLSLLDDRISGSTAVATAMSGNAFLPDMKFNLTANVATYDGAHAGSLQVGALVSPHVALNAGVATGFNREGKTAARAGVTIGF